MKRSLALALIHTSLALSALGLASTPAAAQSARKDCEELKSEIAARMEANGVRHYQLQIVEPEAANVGRIVGSCNGGASRIAYQRGMPATDIDTAAVSLTALETLAQHEM